MYGKDRQESLGDPGTKEVAGKYLERDRESKRSRHGRETVVLRLAFQSSRAPTIQYRLDNHRNRGGHSSARREHTLIVDLVFRSAFRSRNETVSR